MSNLYDIVTGKIIEALRRGVVPWRKPWHAGTQFPVNGLSNRPYRGVNVFLLSLSDYVDDRWMTFKQITELGGKIRPGEKATLVVFWKQSEPSPAREAEEIKPKLEKRSAPILRYYNVWNAEQCEALSLPPIYVPAPLKEHQRSEKGDLLVRSMPNPPLIREEGSSAWYCPREDSVQVPKMKSFSSADHFYSTLFHELTHASGHEKRLNRKGVMGEIRFGSGEYSREELVAELGSAFCSATVGLDNSLIEDSASYINGWLSVLTADPKAVVIAAAQAQRAADYIRGVSYH